MIQQLYKTSICMKTEIKSVSSQRTYFSMILIASKIFLFGLPYMSIYYSRCDLLCQSINYWPIMVFKSVCLCTSKSAVNMCTKMTLLYNNLMPYDTSWISSYGSQEQEERKDLNDHF